MKGSNLGLDRRTIRGVTLLVQLGSLALLFIYFGHALRALSVDVGSHFTLVHELATYGLVRPTSEFMGYMNNYPPLAHWLAAIFSWVFGSGLAGMWLIAIASIYAAYYCALRMAAADGPPAAPVILLGLFALFLPARALVGWEVVQNFFYPQLVATAFFLLALHWLQQRRGPLPAVWLAAAASPLVYMTQPISGTHLTGTLGLFLLAEAGVVWLASRRFAWLHLATAVAVGLIGVATLLLHPNVRNIIMLSQNEGWLSFGVSNTLIYVLAALLAAVFGVNLAAGMKAGEAGRGDRLLASAGLAVILLMIVQYLALLLFSSGSLYATRKHVFVLVTLGLINLARLLGRATARLVRMPAWPMSVQTLAAAALALPVSAAVLTSAPPLWPIQPTIEQLRFAEEFARGSEAFVPGNTQAMSESVVPTSKFLVSVAGFERSLFMAARPDVLSQPQVQYLMVDAKPGEYACAVARSRVYAVVPRDCFAAPPGGRPISFAAGGEGLRFLGPGWYSPEHWGVWSKSSAKLELLLPKRDVTLTVRASAFVSARVAAREIKLTVKGQEVAKWTFDSVQNEAERTLTIPAALIAEGSLTEITFDVAGPPISPKSEGSGQDPRELGMGLISLTMPEG